MFGPQERPARGKRTHDKGSHLGLIVEIVHRGQPRAAEAPRIQHEGSGIISICVIAVELGAVGSDGIASGTILLILNRHEFTEGLHPIAKGLGIADEATGISAEARVTGAEGAAGKVVDDFVVINGG